MSGYSDDSDAEDSMTSRAHHALKSVDPHNEWLQYYNPSSSTVQDGILAKKLWTHNWKYGTKRHDLFQLLHLYRICLARENEAAIRKEKSKKLSDPLVSS